MALQSSGQIKLSEIATEFGGSAPHSMSEYYAGGANVPSGTGSIPTSGEIQLAADFYGTSNIIYLVNGTITSGSTTAKTSVIHIGYSTKVHNTGSTIGSKSLSTDSSLTHIVNVDNNDGSFTSNRAFITMANATAMADLWYAKIGNTTYNRRSGQLEWDSNMLSDTDYQGNSSQTWVYNSGFFGLSNNTTTTVQIAKMNEATWLDTTLTVGHFTRQDSKGNNFPCRGFVADSGAAITTAFPTGNIGGSLGSNALTNPDNNANAVFNIRQIVGIGPSTGGGTNSPTQAVKDQFQMRNSTSTNSFLSRCRGILLTKSGGSSLWIPSQPVDGTGLPAHPSSIIPSGATVITFNNTYNVNTNYSENNTQVFYNFFNTANEQINLKVY